jgi:hypothetical protein
MFWRISQRLQAISLCVIGFTGVQAAPIAIGNPSFESPSFGTGGFGSALLWNESASGGAAGTFAPGPGQYDPSEIPDGVQVAFVNQGFLWQQLTAVLQADLGYLISYYVGNRLDDPFVGYSVELRAGTDPGTSAVLASDSGGSPANGEFVFRQFELDSRTVDPLLYGQPLMIVLRSSGIQTNFDAIAAEDFSVPEPASLLPVGLLLAVGLRLRKQAHHEAPLA